MAKETFVRTKPFEHCETVSEQSLFYCIEFAIDVLVIDFDANLIEPIEQAGIPACVCICFHSHSSHP